MSVGYSIHRDLRLIRVTLSGEVSGGALLEMDSIFREDEEADASYDQLMDCTDAKGSFLTRESLLELTSRPPFFSPESRRAIVVSSKTNFGMARMFELMREDKAGVFRVFYDAHEAESWLKH